MAVLHGRLRKACEITFEWSRGFRVRVDVDRLERLPPAPFAHVVAMRDHVHSHCGSCVHGTSGKVGCRFCSPWAHDVDGCRIVQLRRGERTRGDVCAWCAMCTPDDGSGEKHAAEAKRRGLQCTPSTTISDAPPHGCPDERALAVELSRKLLGTVSPLPPSIGGVTAHIHGTLEARAAGREVCSVVPAADDLVLLCCSD